MPGFKTVECIKAPHGYQRCIGMHGVLVMPEPPSLRCVFMEQDGGQFPIVGNVDDWEFEERAGTGFPPENATQPSVADPIIEAARMTQGAPPARREREQYDANDFAADLDQAINYVRSTALDVFQIHGRSAQPRLRPGMSMRDSVFEVCLALVVRRMDANTFVDLLEATLRDTRQMLISKNAAYGNSALDPVRVFSTASLKEQLLVRLDDKVSRLTRGSAAGEDVAQDMLGYLLLVAIAEKREREQHP